MSSRSSSIGLEVPNRHSNILYVMRYEERFIPYSSDKVLKSGNFLLQECRFVATLDTTYTCVLLWELYMACSSSFFTQ